MNLELKKWWKQKKHGGPKNLERVLIALPGITDSLIATLLWATGQWFWSRLNDPLKKAIRDTDKHFRGKGLPFPVSRIESILEGRADPDKVKKYSEKIESFADSKSLATALLLRAKVLRQQRPGPVYRQSKRPPVLFHQPR